MLRYELGFDGFLVTDYGEINGLHGEHAIAKDNREAVRGFVGGDVVALVRGLDCAPTSDGLD